MKCQKWILSHTANWFKFTPFKIDCFVCKSCGYLGQCQYTQTYVCKIPLLDFGFQFRAVLIGEPKNGTHKNVLSSQNVKYLSTNISKQLLTMKFSLSIIQFDNIAFTHSSVKELSHIRSANKVK